MPHTTQRIVVVGAGFAGLWSALGARRLITSNLSNGGPDIEVTVIAPEPRLVIRPRLYEADPDSMSAPLSELFAATGVKFIKGLVHTITPEKPEVEYKDPETGTKSVISYDKLILAVGSLLQRPAGIPGLDEFAFDVDQIHSATRLENHLKSLACRPSTPARNTIVICGGGFTGLELATELPARLQKLWGKDTNIRVILVDRGTKIGQGLGSKPEPVIAQALKDTGVEVMLGASITSIDAEGVVLATGERIETMYAVWTAGMIANDLIKQIPGEKDKMGRINVDEYLRTSPNQDIFAAGDVALAATDDAGHFALMSCQHAIPLGMVAGHNAAADLLGLEKRTYRQPNYVTCLDLGSYGAVYCDGWDRKVVYQDKKGGMIKEYINRTLIYPPEADSAVAFARADPAGSELDYTPYFRQNLDLA